MTDFVFDPSTCIIHPPSFEITLDERRDLNHALAEIVSRRHRGAMCLIDSKRYRGKRIHETTLGDKISSALLPQMLIPTWIAYNDFGHAHERMLQTAARMGSEEFYRRVRIEWIKQILDDNRRRWK